jgi:phage terminase large subunit-like protein
MRQVYEHGAPIFPTKFSKESLEQLRVEYGGYLFSTQYMMIRQSAEDRKFDRAWLKQGPRIKPGDKGYTFFLSVDPASSRRKTSDFTAMVVIACDWKMNMYLVDGLHDKLDPLQRIEAVFHFVIKWDIHWASYETIGFQQTDEFFIIQKQRELSRYFQIFSINKHKVSKEERILGIQPTMAAGRFFVPPFYAPALGEPESLRVMGIPYTRLWVSPDDGYGLLIDVVEQLALEMDYYPQSTHDDILDVIAQARGIVYAGSIPLPTEAPQQARTAYGKPRAEKTEYNPLVG